MSPKTDVIEQLRAHIAELEEEIGLIELQEQLAAAQEENGRLENQVLARDAELWGRTQEILGLKEQLAAEQLNNKLLRKALKAVIKVHGYESGIPVEALSTQASTEALDKYVAAKVNEIIESHAPEGRNVTNAQHVEMRHKFVEQIATLTRQRDLAVKALENCRLLAARHRKEEWAGHIMRFCKDAGLSGSPIRNDSIKESENNKAS